MQTKIQSYISHTPHPNFPMQRHQIGDKISFDTAIHLVNALRHTPYPLNFCWGFMITDFNASIYNYENGTNANRTYHAKKLESFKNFCKSEPEKTGHISMVFYTDCNFIKCTCAPDIANSNPTHKIEHCHENLSTGKCRDEFMCKTIGATLFPQHYGKQKVR